MGGAFSGPSCFTKMTMNRAELLVQYIFVSTMSLEPFRAKAVGCQGVFFKPATARSRSAPVPGAADEIAAGRRNWLAGSPCIRGCCGWASRGPGLENAPVPGRINIRQPRAHEITENLELAGMAVAGDGHTPYFENTP